MTIKTNINRIKHNINAKNLRVKLHELIRFCTDKEQDVFIRLYRNPSYPTRSIDMIIEQMKNSKLSTALDQVRRTLERRTIGGGVAEAIRLAAQGYAIISRRHCIATRIDRPDWESACLCTNRADADYYRRAHSADRISVTEEVRMYMPKSSSCEINGYIPKD